MSVFLGARARATGGNEPNVRAQSQSASRDKEKNSRRETRGKEITGRQGERETRRQGHRRN